MPFFWDNVSLVSKVAHYYYESNFSDLVLPNAIDSGHPPFYAYYIAKMWSFFGYNLAVSHWAVYPFLVGIGIAYYHLARFFLPEKYIAIAMTFLLIEPTLMAQSVMGGLDLPMVFAYLLALNGLLYRKRHWLSLAFCIMALVNLRGIIAVFLLVWCDILVWYFLEKKAQKKWTMGQFLGICSKRIIAYIPVALIVIVWYNYHYEKAGFLVFNYDSPWADEYGFVNFRGFMWNVGLVFWRILDFGRVFLWLAAAYLGLQMWRQKQVFSRKQILLILLFIVPLIFYIPLITARETPVLHRYLMTYYLLFGLIVLSMINILQNNLKQKALIALLCGGLLTGHSWALLYPAQWAKGWDACLAYLPFFGVQEQLYQYLDEKNIDYQLVGTGFPAVASSYYTHLNKDKRQFSTKEKVRFSDNSYILHTNISNDFSDAELQTLAKEAQLLVEYRSCGVFVRLYQVGE